MQCPTDASTLVMSERSGIEIDYCPQCRGVWLDRGELDKIIERSASEQSAWAHPLLTTSYEVVARATTSYDVLTVLRPRHPGRDSRRSPGR